MSVHMHPLLESFRDARKGESVTPELLKSHTAIVREALEGDGEFIFNPLKIAARNRLDSIDISKMMKWLVEAGHIENITSEEPFKYRLTLGFCRLYSIPPVR